MNPELFLMFPTPILKFRLDKHREHKETYLPDLLEIFNNRSGNPSLHVYEHENSYQLFHHKNIDDKQIDIMCDQYAKYLSGGMPYGTTYLESWFNVHTQEMHQASHEHFGAFFSGIYYLKFDKELDYPTTFQNPNSKYIENWCNRSDEVFDPNVECLASSTFPNYMNIEEGDVVLFPPYLTHFVPCSKKGSDTRVTYTFNIKFI